MKAFCPVQNLSAISPPCCNLPSRSLANIQTHTETFHRHLPAAALLSGSSTSLLSDSVWSHTMFLVNVSKPESFCSDPGGSWLSSRLPEEILTQNSPSSSLILPLLERLRRLLLTPLQVAYSDTHGMQPSSPIPSAGPPGESSSTCALPSTL